MEETLEQMQARHRKEQRDLVARTTSKKKNATKKTRKGVNDECAELERVLKERQAEELAAAARGEDQEQDEEEEEQMREQAAADAATDEIDELAGRLGGAAMTETQGKEIRDTAEWGGQLELAALAARYGVEIKVVQDGRTETIETPSGGKDGKATEVIWLAYYPHGYGLGEHYNSLRKAA
ncbi:predicted protein [Verticillium alfalfae VaMs.102]|uniref:Predicted protein n=1 Tax=Verticillium alfalfae (strain VaMs.102 / ATCC MYA-4576 / FGSC 10136) TaxID=526221 RepID=C9S5D1_VERA1|nr:predicted protein [Verticillium alfalfae VaMs.102]EEY14203.1 predicted protein [Verticillium alfalfae VaMs.102]